MPLVKPPPKDYTRAAAVVRAGDTSTPAKRMIRSLEFFHKRLGRNIPLARYVELDLVDVFLALARDVAIADEIRAASMKSVVILLEKEKGPAVGDCLALRHTVLDKDVLDVVEAVIGAASHDTMIHEECIQAIQAVSKGCNGICFKKLVESTAFKTLITIVVSVPRPLDNFPMDSAVDVCATMMKNAVYGPAAADTIMTAICSVFSRGDQNITKHTLIVLRKLTCEHRVSLERFSPQVISSVLECASGPEPVADAALEFIRWSVPYGDPNGNVVWIKPEFMNAIVRALGGTSRVVQEKAIDVLWRLVNSSIEFADLLIQSATTVGRLRHLLRDDVDLNDNDGQTLTRDEIHFRVCELLLQCLKSLNHSSRPYLQHVFLGYGILRPLLVTAKALSTNRAYSLDYKVERVLGPLLATRPEFSRDVEAAGYGHLVPARGNRRTDNPGEYWFQDEDME